MGAGASGEDEALKDERAALPLPAVYRGASPLTLIPLWIYAAPAFFVGSILLVADHPWLAAIALALALTASVAVLYPTRFVVGQDGISIGWWWRRRFLFRHEIAGISSYDQGFGRSRLSGVALTLKDGTVVKVPLEADVGLVCRSVRQAFGVAGGEVTAAAAMALARGDLPIKAWFSRLRAVGAEESDQMRAPAVRREELWTLVASPTATSSERAAAAIALRGSPEEDIKPRLVRVAAETVEPKLRVLLEHTAAGSSDEELQQAFIELEQERRRDA